jgi:hypothetical protein
MFSHGLCDQFVIHLASINQYSPKKPFWLMLSFLNVEAVLVIDFTLTPSPPPFPPFAIPSSPFLKPAQAGFFFYLSFQKKNTYGGVKKSIKK